MTNKHKKDIVDGWYVSRLIDSLEKDYKKWERRHLGGNGWSWIEYNSPEYKNEYDMRLQFSFGLNNRGAYVDGMLSWDIPFRYRYNIFDSRMWRLHKAYHKMKKYLKKKEEQKHLNKLVKAL